ncbi:MAG: DegT/DnrJ/EryC1/StrS family aminotransferase [Rhodospirillaceae bacterium]|nr:DegT/DnrJ/EryC1/StrS family aminotransferase [Rhodospirillaceae bacterium]
MNPQGVKLVHGGAAEEPIEFIDLQAQRRRIEQPLMAALRRVLEHGRYIMGPEVAQLESRLAEYCGVAHALTCANGTDALGLILRAKGIGPGDAVIVPAFTFAATAEVVCWFGATPVFTDVLPDTFNMDPASLRHAVARAVALGLRPAAVIVVDLFGQPADYDALAPIAAEHGLTLICDAAQSFGARYKGRRVGQIGWATATSFFPAKPLGCYGDGGAVFTDDAELAHAIDSLRQHGKGGHKYDIPRVGVNSRLDTLQAAVLLEKLKVFDDEVERRQRAVDRYARLLGDVVTTPRVIDGATSVWAQYTIQVDAREAVAAALKAQGIPTAVHYPVPLHRQPAYAGLPGAGEPLPVCERHAGRVLSLPMHPYLDEATQARIAGAVRAALS